MLRSHILPTPASSTDLVGKDKLQNSEMESVFSLPPPALPSKKTTATSPNGPRSAVTTGQSSPPSSPKDTPVGPTRDRKRTLSGTNKQSHDAPTTTSAATIADGVLPPPPSRARKIIQMKPKQISNRSDDHQTQTQTPPKAAPVHKDDTATSASASKRKQTQKSTTSAAGRKIARKTAHSIIERRRRNKMNEEFAVLKDMIPACCGIEMHKLAILQAGIEYVRYLEGCIEQLKAQNESVPKTQSTPHSGFAVYNQDDDGLSMDIDQDDEQNDSRPASSAAVRSESGTSSPVATPRLSTTRLEQKPLPSFRRPSVLTSTTNSSYASPDLHPMQADSSLSIPPAHQRLPAPSRSSTTIAHLSGIYSTSPPPLSAKTPLQSGVSPAFEAFNFSPDLGRTSRRTSMHDSMVSVKPALNVLPLPQAAMSLPQHASLDVYNGSGSSNGPSAAPHNMDVIEGHAEATATAALLMMTRDRRISVSRTSNRSSKGMSVKDLLSS